MQRYDRSRFLAFGVLPALNALGLLLYGLGLATRGGGEQSVPALLVIAALCLLVAMVATIRRGRDIGWSGWITALLFWAAVSLGPALLILIAYFVFARRKNDGDRFGPPPAPAGVITWTWAVLNLLWPWMALAVLSKVL